MSAHLAETRLADIEAIRNLVQRTAALLDQEQLDAWVDLFDAEGTYEISAYSTEIRRWMTWQLSDRDALVTMLRGVEEHVRDPARRRHVVSLPLVELDGERARVTAHFALFRTTPEGQSSLYMVGGYDDRVVKRTGGWRYLSHKVVVDTRMLDIFTHIPV
jgi:3-phenylpropionate/cinnamic acid dioxygenase small subunit